MHLFSQFLGVRSLGRVQVDSVCSGSFMAATTVLTGMCSHLETKKAFTSKSIQVDGRTQLLGAEGLDSLLFMQSLDRECCFYRTFIVPCHLASSHKRATFSEAAKRVFLSSY